MAQGAKCCRGRGRGAAGKCCRGRGLQGQGAAGRKGCWAQGLRGARVALRKGCGAQGLRGQGLLAGATGRGCWQGLQQWAQPREGQWHSLERGGGTALRGAVDIARAGGAVASVACFYAWREVASTVGTEDRPSKVHQQIAIIARVGGGDKM